jgi:predicted permease
MSSLTFAFRMLAKTPFVTAIAIASLAFGIGANVAIFSLFDRLVLRPLPVPDPHELVSLSAPGPKPGSQSSNQAGRTDSVFSFPMYRDLDRLQTVFTGIAAHRLFGANLAFRGQTFSGDGVLVSGNYFALLGLQPALGRLLAPADASAADQSAVAVLGYEYWRTRFGQAADVLDQALIVNGQALTIVGVAPQGFQGTTLGAQPEVFVPITMRGLMEPRFSGLEDRRNYWAYLFARLRPGVSITQARAALGPSYTAILNDVEAPLQRGMSEQTMARFRAKTIGIEEGARGQSNVLREARTPLLMLLAVTCLVLIIACANIANLLLARAATRAGEISVRIAIGASRWQLIRQLLTESVVLATLGGLAGLAVARATIDAIFALMPAQALPGARAELDGTALLFAAAVTIATGILFGLFPALHATRGDQGATLKGQSAQSTGSRSASRFRTSLATAQIALSMTLLVTSGLFVRSLLNVSRVDLGLQVDDVITFGISPELNGYTSDRSLALFERVEDELSAIPGVSAVSSSMVPLLSSSNWGSDVAVEGFEAGPDTDSNSRFNAVGPGYFQTLGIPLLAGRDFTRSDVAATSQVVIVNEQFARKFNLGRDAVGKRIGTGNGRASELALEIVGLVKDAKYSEVKDPVPPLFFRPYRQQRGVGSLNFFVRSSLPAEQVLGAVRQAIQRLDPNLPVEDLITMPQQVRDNVFVDRIISILSAAFAGLATLLAAIGLYGVLAYSVAQRTMEMGLRMALGAGPRDIRHLILRQVLRMMIIGGVVGLLAAVGLGRGARSLLFEVEGHDPLVFVGAAVALTIVALGAGLVPAMRAAQVDPIKAIRYE